MTVSINYSVCSCVCVEEICVCVYLSQIGEFCSRHFQLQIIYLRQSKVYSCQKILGDNQKWYDIRSDVWGFKFIFSYAHSLCVFVEGGLPPNNTTSTLKWKSVGLELKAIKPRSHELTS